MSDLNCCAFIGRLTKDAELKMIGAKQTPCAEFTIANNTWAGSAERTNYINVQLWGQQATNMMKFLQKGKQVAVSGEFNQNDWTDQNGGKHTTWRLNSRSVTLLASSRNQQNDNGGTYEPDEAVF